MVIRFSCPQGHPLTCPGEAAGRKSKCPECGASVVIPAQSTRGGPQDQIVFLCPNGHRLNGPKSLEGKAGQCPHCGAKFRVPSSEDPVEEEESSPAEEIADVEEAVEESEQASAASDSGMGEAMYLEEVEEVEEAGGSSGGGFGFRFDDGTEATDDAAAASGNGAASAAGLSRLFPRLWQERDRGAIVELHLADGVVIVPERFAAGPSRRTHGVFAVKDPDGTHTLTVVPWQSVERITVRRLTKLPKELFE